MLTRIKNTSRHYLARGSALARKLNTEWPYTAGKLIDDIDSERFRSLAVRARGRGRRLVWAEPRAVPIDSLLLGGQDSMTAREFAAASGWTTWPSTRLIDGPHVDFYEQFATTPVEEVTDEAIMGSRYGELVSKCLDLYGKFRAGVDVPTVCEFLRSQLELYQADDARTALSACMARERPVVRPVRYSDCYEVVHGHHRIAQAWLLGERDVEVDVTAWHAVTPLQAHLLRMSWLDGKRHIYQPLPFRELESDWVLVRSCTDRIRMMRGHLDENGPGPGASYLDVASCYGWFVAEMTDLGYDAEGIERDPLGIELGQIAYGLSEGRVRAGEAIDYLNTVDRQWDVVSCFSLLHHFQTHEGDAGSGRLLRALDKVVGDVLFLDTGQVHEAALRANLPGWDDDGVEEVVMRHTSFTKAERLGTDTDDRPPLSGNYARTLFAFRR